MKRPAFQFYPGDWQRSPRLRMLSLAAKGLWIEMLCIMHSAEPYGHLKIGESALDEAALARFLSVGRTQIVTLLRDLDEVGVFSRTEDGVIFSRRMVRDEQLRENRAAGGSRSLHHPNASRPGEKRGGGRPPSQPDMGFGKGFEKNPLDNPPSARASSSSSSDTDTLRVSAPTGLEWVQDLRVAVTAIANVKIRDLTIEQRVLCGRYHAWRFANCTKSEPTNIKRGASSAKAFAQMADADRFRDFTVREYADHAAVYQRDVLKGAPFHDPFAIRTIFDVKPDSERRR